MSHSGSALSGLRPFGLTLPAAPIADPRYEILGTLILGLCLMSVAAWNGFPIIFYDTGAYMLQGLGHLFIAERSPIYSFFLSATGGATSLWLVAGAQCLIVAFAMVEFARAIRPQMSLWALTVLGVALCIATGLPWYAGQIEPDCFVGVVPLALYVLAFHRPDALRATLLVAAATIAIACHSSHIALAAGLLVALAALRYAPAAWTASLDLPKPRLALAAASLVLAVLSVYVANYVFTKHVFFSRSGAIFLEARMMEDDLIRPVLDTDCGRTAYAICPYRDKLPARADTWLWMESQSPFKKVGGFEKRGPESARLVRESLLRYPLENAIVALQDAALQFFWFQTGDGIVPQEWVLDHEFKIAIPRQMSDYSRAYQQEGEIWFLPVNLVHVPMAVLTLIGLYLVLRNTVRRRDWRGTVMPGFVALALIGNAVVCGVFSGPHGRYQSRIMWLPTFAIALRAWPRIENDIARRIAFKSAVA